MSGDLPVVARGRKSCENITRKRAREIGGTDHASIFETNLTPQQVQQLQILVEFFIISIYYCLPSFSPFYECLDNKLGLYKRPVKWFKTRQNCNRSLQFDINLSDTGKTY
jgi:hypothetical protein